MNEQVKLLEGEQIKDIKGFEGRFLITNFGRLFSVNGKYKGIKEFNVRVDNVGYNNCLLRNKTYKRACRVHQLVAENFLEKPEWADCVNHLDGNKLNNHVSNLEWTTRALNCKHAVDTRLHDIKGEKHHSNKLTELEIKEIFRLRNEGLSHQKIADTIGKVQRRHVTDILNGKCWGWLTQPST